MARNHKSTEKLQRSVSSLVMLKRELSFEKENKDLEKKKVKHITSPERTRLHINTTDIQIQEHLPLASKGADYNLYACDVDGWRCMVKELDLTSLPSSARQRWEQEVSLLEQIPFHSNIVRYLFHTRLRTGESESLLLFMSFRDITLKWQLVREAERVQERLGSEGILSDSDTAENLVRPHAWSAQQITAMALDLVRGIMHLHKHKVMHRWISTQSTYIQFDSRGHIARLSLGNMHSAKRIRKHDQARTFIGSPAYIAPEVYRVDGAYSYSADVYSFGMLLYAMLALQEPFHDVSPMYVYSLMNFVETIFSFT